MYGALILLHTRRTMRTRACRSKSCKNFAHNLPKGFTHVRLNRSIPRFGESGRKEIIAAYACIPFTLLPGTVSLKYQEYKLK
jgi:hypothetical protein